MGGTFNFKTVAVLFGVVLLCYVAVFRGIEYWRQHQGPWVVQFETNQQGRPLLLIEHSNRHINNVRLVFAQETTSATNLPARLTFDRPRQPLPFGARLHEDLVSLPGVETWDLFGHVIELAPRRLAVNGRAVPWTSGQTIELWSTNKPPAPLAPAKSIEDTVSPRPNAGAEGK